MSADPRPRRPHQWQDGLASTASSSWHERRHCERCGAVLVVHPGGRPGKILLPVWMGGAEVDSSLCVPPPRRPPPRWFASLGRPPG